MKDFLTLEDIDEQVKSQVYIQNYTGKETIEGVKIIELENNLGEEGDFSEIIQINTQGHIKQLPNFKIAQINRTKLHPGSIKAWHLHFKQDEVWYLIPSGQLFVGMWDVRRNSKSRGITMRIVLGGGTSQLLFIPRGVAHGSANFTIQPIELFYFVNQRFEKGSPDEKRIHWDALGKEFWTPERD